MLAVVIPTLNAAASLPAALASLAPGQGWIEEIVVADGGSSDGMAGWFRLRLDDPAPGARRTAPQPRPEARRPQLTAAGQGNLAGIVIVRQSGTSM